MTFDIEKIIESKRVMRSKLATLPIAEKLRMLDELRERELSLRASSTTRTPLTNNKVAPSVGGERAQ